MIETEHYDDRIAPCRFCGEDNCNPATDGNGCLVVVQNGSRSIGPVVYQVACTCGARGPICVGDEADDVKSDGGYIMALRTWAGGGTLAAAKAEGGEDVT